MKKEQIDYVKMALDVDKGCFGIADQKNGVWLAFPIRKFNKKDNGGTEVTIIVPEEEIETISDMNKWLKEMTEEHKQKVEDDKINVFALCWCDGTGIAKPYKVEDGNIMKCQKCKNKISITAMENDERVMDVLSQKGEKYLEMK